MGDTGVALSGGGHRASLFGLGALLYLADVDRNRRVCSIASVSGGSITNAFVAQELCYREAAPDAFEKAMQPLAARLAHEGTVQWAPATRRWLTTRVAPGLAATALPWLLPGPKGTRALAQLAGVVGVGAVLANQRGDVAAEAFAETLFSPGGTPTRLAELAGRSRAGVDHVLCATDLQSFEQVYLSPTFVYGYRFGVGTPADLRLADAVQASAALPGAFPPRWLPTAPFGFRGALDRPPDEQAPWLVLVDGGVYDNMADQWAHGMEARLRRWDDTPAARPEPLPHVPDDLVVVNASAGLGWRAMGRAARLPLVGELLAISRDKDLLYDTSTSLRRQALAGRFDRAILAGRGLRGALVHIPQSPFDVAAHFATQRRLEGEEYEQRRRRATRVLAALGEHNAPAWQDVARANASVATTLAALGGDAAARLVWHGYVLAMANCHVILDYPVADVPGIDRFRRLVGVRSRRSGS